MIQELFQFLTTHFNIPIYLVSFVVSLFFYRRYFDTELKYFPALIAYTFFNELLGYFIRYTDGFAFSSEKEYLNANDIIYNIYSVVFFSFFFFVYWRLSKKYKKWILYGAAITIVSFVVSCFYQNPFIQSLYYPTVLGSYILVFVVILYLKGLEPNLRWSNQKHNLLFWVSLGLGIFYLIFPIIYLIGFLNYELWLKLNLRMVLRALIVLMHGLFVTGFLLGRRKSFQ